MSNLRFALLALASLYPACGSDMKGVDPALGPSGPGDSCEEAVPVALDPSALPASFGGDTGTQRDDYNLVACVERLGDDVPGQGSADGVFRLRSETSALYRLTLQGTWPAPTALALTSDCAAFSAGARTSCEAASYLGARVGEPSLDAFLEAGRDYFLLVDGLHAEGRPDQGAFTVAVGCGCAAGETCTAAGVCRAAQPGDSCADPIVMTLSDPMTTAFALEGSTVAQPDGNAAPAACSADGLAHGALAPDRFHQLTAPSDGRYTVTLESLGEGHVLGLSAYAACTAERGTGGSTCMASARTGAATATASLELDLHAEDVATLVVDGVDGDAGLYRLSVGPPCVPSCASCGISDGCGRVCGCADGEQCSGGLCVTAPDLEGNTCDNPIDLDGETLPLTVAGDLGPTSGLTDALNALGCPDVQATGATVRDEVFRLIAPEAGSYTFSVEPRTPGADVMLYGFSNVCQADSCLGWSDAVAAPRAEAETLTLRAEAGDELFVVVDAWRPEAAGAFELVAEKTCTPRCDTGCGTSDGCGGTCGCAPGDRCDAGSCTPAESIAGNTCQSAHELLGSGFPFTADGDVGPTGGMTAALSAAACDAYVTGGSAPDEVWRFAAPSNDVYEVTVTPHASGVDLMLYAFDDASCTIGCVAFADEAHGDAADGSERITLTTTSSQVFYLVVDAWGAGFGGPFTLSVDTACTTQCGATCGGPDGCGGTCGCGATGACEAGVCVDAADLPGNTCSAPFELGTTSVAGDLSRDSAAPSYAASGCVGAGDAGASGHDEVWRFVAPAAGAFDVTLQPDLPLDLMLYAFGDTCAPASCLAYADRHGSSLAAETLRLEASAAGEVFHVVVDGWNAAALGTYRLSAAPACATTCASAPCGADDGCGGRCGCADGDLCRDGVCIDATEVAGDGCENPRRLSGTLPLIGQGDLSAFQALSDDLDAGSCATAGATGVGAPDEVWSFVAPAVGAYQVTVTPDAGDPLGDLLVYAFPSDACGGTCLGHADQAGPEGAERLLITATYAGETFNLVVDAWLPGTADRYRITVDRPCTPSCRAGSCADDGCGAPCPCASDEVCGPASACVDARPGDTCAVAQPLGFGPVPWFAAGDLGPGSGLTDTTSPAACGGPATSGVDQIWSLTPPAAGRYELVAAPEGSADLVLYAFSGSCDGTCIALSNDAGPGGEERMTINTLPSERLWIAVDAAEPLNGGRYTLSLDTVCTPQCGGACGGPDGCGGTCGCGGGAVCLADGSCAAATSIPGNTCQAPLALVASGGAWVGQGDIDRAAALSDALDASACGVAGAGRGVNDQIWSFTAPSAGDWEAVVTPKDNADLMLYAFGDTLCTTCLGHVDRDYLGGRAETLLLPALAAGQAVRIVVDAFAPEAGGAYSLRVAKRCEPRCLTGCGQADGCGGVCGCAGDALCDAATFACVAPEASLGNTCAAPRPIALGQTKGGDLSAEVFLGAELRAVGCPGVGAFDGAGRDEVWWFAAPATGAYRLELAAAPDSDPMLYAFSGDACAAASCLAFADAGGDGAGEGLVLQLVSGEVVHVVVDTWTASSGGAYTLTVEGP